MTRILRVVLLGGVLLASTRTLAAGACDTSARAPQPTTHEETATQLPSPAAAVEPGSDETVGSAGREPIASRRADAPDAQERDATLSRWTSSPQD